MRLAKLLAPPGALCLALFLALGCAGPPPAAPPAADTGPTAGAAAEGTAAEGTAAGATAAPGLAGTYVSGALPAADAPSMRLTLALTEAGQAALTTVYEGKGMTQETGAWQLDGDTLGVRLDMRGGTPVSGDQPLTFTVTGDTLTSTTMSQPGGEPVTLTRAGAAAAAGAATTAAGSYAAALPAADAEARKIALTLAPDGSATLATSFIGKDGAYTETGSWTESEGRVLVTLSLLDGTPVAQATELAFSLDDGNLVSLDWDRAQYGEAGLGTLLRQP